MKEQKEVVPIEVSPKTEKPSLLWRGLNFSTHILATSTYITLVQSPIKSFIVNGQNIPTYQSGIFTFVKFCYAGVHSAFAGSMLRTTYVTQSKGNKPNEPFERLEPMTKPKLSPWQYVMGVALGDVLVTQIPESLSTLRKRENPLPTSFVWDTPHNLGQLMRGGFCCRYIAGLGNFASLCLLEDKLVSKIPVDNPQAKHFIAGSLSGITAAFFAHPFASMKEHLLQQAEVNKEGKLVHQRMSTALSYLNKQLKDSPKEACSYLLTISAKQLLLRMLMNSLVFSGIAFVNSALGPEPLNDLMSSTSRTTPKF
jgi:hypothetical protein